MSRTLADIPPRIQTRAASDPDQLQTREVMLTRAAPSTLNEEERSIRAVLATEDPVLIYDWERGAINEVLLMSGLKVPEQIPLLDAHSRFRTSSVLGSVREIGVEADKLMGRLFFATTAPAEEAYTLVREKHIDSTSIGYRVLAYVWVEDGETAEIQGKTFTGPVKVCTEWEAKEESLVPIPADDKSKIRAAKGREPQKEKKPMNEKLRKILEKRGLIKKGATDEEARQALAGLSNADLAAVLAEAAPEQRAAEPAPAAPPAPQPDPQPAVDDEAARAAAQAERQRITEIQAMGRNYSLDEEQVNQWVTGGTTVQDARMAAVDLVLSRQSVQPPARVQTGADGDEKRRAAITDSILIRGGIQVENPAEGADEFTGYSLRALCRESLRRAGITAPASPIAMVSRAFSTSDLPYMMADAANKTLLNTYNMADETWREWCGVGSINDFKTLNIMRDSEISALLEIPEGGPYTQATLTEAKETVQLAKYGRRFALTWESVVNDDLNALTGIPEKFGRAAARKNGDVAYTVLTANANMGDGVALFHSTHGNLPSAAALSVASMGLAVKAMRIQKDEAGVATLNIPPRFFIAPGGPGNLLRAVFRLQFRGHPGQAQPGEPVRRRTLPAGLRRAPGQLQRHSLVPGRCQGHLGQGVFSSPARSSPTRSTA